MTMTQAPVATGAAEQRPTARGRGRIVAWAVVGGLALLAVVGLLVWQSVVQSALSGVRVTYDADPIRCQGAEVGVYPGVADDDGDGALFFDEEFQQAGVELTPGMRCALRIQVVNEGWTDIEVTEVFLRFFGEGSGLAFSDVMVGPNGQARLPLVESDGFVNDIDAAFRIDGGIPVSPEQPHVFVAVFDYAGDAQMAECSWMGVNVPVVTFQAFGQSATAAPRQEQAIVFHQPDPNGCG